MADRALIESAMASLLKPRGFRKTRSTWHRLQPEVVLVVNVQKSNWGARLYVNLGVYLRGLGQEVNPPERECHIRTRLDGLLVDSDPFFDALDLESRLSDADRERIVGDAIVRSALPWLEARETNLKARAALLAEKEPTGPVMVIAKMHLGLDPAVEQAVEADGPPTGTL
jgi:Domain of unknown function (DUF4304)